MRKIRRILLCILLAVVVTDNIAYQRRFPCASSNDIAMGIDPENMWNTTEGSHLTNEDPDARENVWPNGMRRSRAQMETKRPFHVLVLGCSFTFGVGLDDDKTYVWRLNELMPVVEFDNGAVGGYGPLQCLIRQRRLMKFKKYDCVIYSYINDHFERGSIPKFRISNGHERVGNDVEMPRRDVYVLPYTELNSKFEFIDHKLHRYYFPGASLSPLSNLLGNYCGVFEVKHQRQPQENEQYMIFASQVNRMAQVAAAYGSKFLLISLDGTRVNDLARNYSPLVTYFDNRFYKDFDRTDLIRQDSRNHPGPEVNDYWARKLANYLERTEVFGELINHCECPEYPNHRRLYDLEHQPVTWPW